MAALVSVAAVTGLTQSAVISEVEELGRQGDRLGGFRFAREHMHYRKLYADYVRHRYGKSDPALRDHLLQRWSTGDLAAKTRAVQRLGFELRTAAEDAAAARCEAQQVGRWRDTVSSEDEPLGSDDDPLDAALDACAKSGLCKSHAGLPEAMQKCEDMIVGLMGALRLKNPDTIRKYVNGRDRMVKYLTDARISEADLRSLTGMQKCAAPRRDQMIGSVADRLLAADALDRAHRAIQ